MGHPSWLRPRIGNPYVQRIVGAQQLIEVPRVNMEEHPVPDMYQKELQFNPSKVGKLLTGPKNTGKTMLNNIAFTGIPHLGVNFRGRVQCTQNIIKEMDDAFSCIHQLYQGLWKDVGVVASNVRTGTSALLTLLSGLDLIGSDIAPEWVTDYSIRAWKAANVACLATTKLGIEDPIERWETAIRKHAEACASSNYTIMPLYIRLEELNSALPRPEKRLTSPKEYDEQVDFVTRLMEMLVRVTKEDGLTQVVMTTSDHAFQEVVNKHWGGGHAEVMCLGYMDKAATMDYLTHERIVDEEMRELIWQTCGGSFPQLNGAITDVHMYGSMDKLTKSLEGEMAQTVGFLKRKMRGTDLDKTMLDETMQHIAEKGFVPWEDVPKEVFSKLIEANAASFRFPCKVEEFALDLPQEARGIDCVTAFNPREQEALRRIYNVQE